MTALTDPLAEGAVRRYWRREGCWPIPPPQDGPLLASNGRLHSALQAILKE